MNLYGFLIELGFQELASVIFKNLRAQKLAENFLFQEQAHRRETSLCWRNIER